MKRSLKFIDPNGQTFSLTELSRFPAKIGRSTECEIVLNHPSISRVHCLLEEKDKEIYLIDNGSVNGIKFASKKVTQLNLSKNKNFKLGELVGIFEEEAPVSESVELSEESLFTENTVVPGTEKQNFAGNKKKHDAEFDMSPADKSGVVEDNTASFVLSSPPEGGPSEEDIFSAKTVIKPLKKEPVLKKIPSTVTPAKNTHIKSKRNNPDFSHITQLTQDLNIDQGQNKDQKKERKGPSIFSQITAVKWKIEIPSMSTKSMGTLGMIIGACLLVWFFSTLSLGRLFDSKSVSSDEMNQLIQETISTSQSQIFQ